MKSWTKTMRMLRQLVHRLDERTLLSDQLLGSRMLRDSLLPWHWQARVYWRTNGELCPDKIEYYLCDLFATYHELELEMMAVDARPRLHVGPPALVRFGVAAVLERHADHCGGISKMAEESTGVPSRKEPQ